MDVSWFRDAYTPAPVPGRVSWPALVERLTVPRPLTRRGWVCPVKPARRTWSPGACGCGCALPLVLDKRSAPAWSAWTYRTGELRSDRSAVMGSAIVVDYDGGISLDEARQTWAEWEHAAHTSWSHRDPLDARVRVVVPLACRVPARAWPRVWAWLAEWEPRQDLTVGDAGRLWFLPSLVAGVPFESWHNRGAAFPLRWHDLPEHPSERRPAPPPVGDLVERDRYRVDASARRELGVKLSAQISGAPGREVARHVLCPSCRRRSVWWRLDPRAGCPGAFCDHKNRCGWVGWLDQIEAVAA